MVEKSIQISDGGAALCEGSEIRRHVSSECRYDQNVVRIIESRRPSPILVVVSACAGVTNGLLRALHSAALGKLLEAIEEVHELKLRHEIIAKDLLANDRLTAFIRQLKADCAEMRAGLSLVAEKGDPSGVRSDAIVSFGERWSSRLLNQSLAEGEVATELVDAGDLLVTNNEFTKATPLFEDTNANVRTVVLPFFALGKVVVTQGFVGRTLDGFTTTIGRGGSDYSASIFGAALGVAEIEIWTDTDGILSADPRLVPDAVPLAEISTEEATELAHFGAKVVHPSTLAPATDAGIPVKILNSRKPSARGTLIRPSNGAVSQSRSEVKSVTGKKGVCTVAIRKDKRMNKFHFLQHVFHVLEDHKEAVEFISSSETGVLVLTNDEEDHQPFLDELRHHDGVEIREGLAIVCAVGALNGGERSALSQIHDVLLSEEIPSYLTYHGFSQHSVAVVVDGERFEEAVTLLHERLVKRTAAPASPRGSGTQVDSPSGFWPMRLTIIRIWNH